MAVRSTARGPAPSEVSSFKARLREMPVETLRDKLESPARGTPWQRELAQAEMDTREAAVADDGGGAPARKGGVRLWGGLVAGVLIAGSCAIIGYAGWLVWTMEP